MAAASRASNHVPHGIFWLHSWMSTKIKKGDKEKYFSTESCNYLRGGGGDGGRGRGQTLPSKRLLLQITEQFIREKISYTE